MHRITRGTMLRGLAAIVGVLTLTAAVAAAVSSAHGTTKDRAASAASAGAVYTGSATVAYLVPARTITRWYSEDIPDYEKAIKAYAPNLKILTYQANGSVSTQFAQVQSAITQGAKVLILAAAASNQSGGIVAYANRHHVPIIVMERPLANGNVCCMVGDDPEKIGEVMGQWIVAHTKAGSTVATIWGDPTDSFATSEKTGVMKYLGPLVKSGQRKMAGNVYTTGWLPANAGTEMDAILTSTHDKVDAVVAANDDLAQAVIASLARVGLAGKIPVTGIDATLDGVQDIIKGLQAISVYRPYSYQAHVLAEATAYLLAGKPFPSGLFPSKINNGLKTIPFAAAPAEVLTKATVGSLISQGVYSKAQVCQGIKAGVGPC